MISQLVSIDEMSVDELEGIISLARNFVAVQARDVPKVPALRGKTIVLAFFEDSTRTRTSFDLAARRLSADVVNFSASASSLKKGESLRDTIETISAMGVDAIVIRHGSSGAAAQVAKWTDAAIINAGDGQHQHPTQALLDAFTITERIGTLEGKKVILCGDIRHSRVARSNVAAFTKLGAEVVLVAPRTLLPASLDGWPVTVEPSLDSVLSEVDVAYFLRVQHERMGQALIPSEREYRTLYGLTAERAARIMPGSVIMHPGPMNRGVEIDPEVAADPRSLVLDQVANGIPVRMAALFATLGPGRFASSNPAGLTKDADLTESVDLTKEMQPDLAELS